MMVNGGEEGGGGVEMKDVGVNWEKFVEEEEQDIF